MFRHIIMAVLCGLLFPLFAIPNGGFEEKGSWSGYPYSNIERTDKEAHSGKFAMRLIGQEAGKVTQLFSDYLPLAATPGNQSKIRVSFFYKGDSFLFHLRLYELQAEKEVAVKNEQGEVIAFTFNLKKTDEWTEFRREITLPAKYLENLPRLRLHFQLWGKSVLSETLLDDVTLELPEVTAPPTASGARLTIEPLPSDDGGIVPMPDLPYRYGQKDGYLTRDGKPFYYAGNYTIGGGQWQLNTLWMHRLLNYSMLTLDWSMNYGISKEKSGDYRLRYHDSRSAASAVREITRQGIIIEFDNGNYMPEYNPIRYVKGVPGLDRIFVNGSHFYSLDHNTPEGRKIHYLDWRSRFCYYKNLHLMAFESWNELGYTPSHERVLADFRIWTEKKYGSLAEANRVWRCNFKSWEEVRPPHLSTDILPGASAHQYRLAMRDKYFEQYYDYLRFLGLDFMVGFKEMKKEFRTFSDAPWGVDTRAHRHYADGYGVLDPDLLEDTIDIVMLHTWINSFEYNGEPAALLFEAEETAPLVLPGIAPVRQKWLDEISSWDKLPVTLDTSAPKALFLAPLNSFGRIGRTAYPQLTYLLHRSGVETRELPLAEITPEVLKKFRFVFLAEDHAGSIAPLVNGKHPIYDMLIDYVREGGGLFCVGTSARGSTGNARQSINWNFGQKLGFNRGNYARNPLSCGYSDDMQVKALHFADHPVTRGLKAVQFFTLPVFVPTSKCELKPLVKTAPNDLAAPNAAIVLGGTLGKGKAVFLPDALWMQPFRVEAEDNLRLLANLIAYLTDTPPLDPADATLLFMTEKEMRAAEAVERR
ncbi:MAG: beta-galactosidase [Victivallales bacterium]|jgi:hypothetical protein|nr:beta-galactosidase [Victivallales bacterium]